MLRFIIFTVLAIALSLSCKDTKFESEKKQSVKKNQSTPALPAKPDEEKSDTRVKDEFKGSEQVSQKDLDIIFAIDTSGSMTEEIINVRNNIKNFLEKLNSNARVVPNLVFVFGSFQSSIGSLESAISNLKSDIEKLPNSTHVDFNVDSYSSLRALALFFTKQIGGQMSNLDSEWDEKYKGSQDFDTYSKIKEDTLFYLSKYNIKTSAIRSDSIKELIVVTDDDAKYNPPATVKYPYNAEYFLTFLKKNEALLKNVRLNGFIGLPTTKPDANCQLTFVGNEYIKIQEDLAYKGELFDICNPNWNEVFTKLAENISERVKSSTFKLTQKAINTSNIEVIIDGRKIETGWTYDSNSNSINFEKEKAPLKEQSIEIKYDVEKKS